ncbi:MAG: hypothetical protein M3O34_15390, partial [Chloroflexota bacterium]|nr:hypothetical protein [Chloroflexota bacterium]
MSFCAATLARATGVVAVEVIFPTAGTYVFYDQFARSTGQDILQRDELIVGAASDPAALVEDLSPKTLGAVQVDLHGDGPARVGEDAQLVFRVADARTGQGLSSLEPYLGAAAHVIIVRGDGETFAHTYGMAVGGGLYKTWGQLQVDDGQIFTADFAARVGARRAAPLRPVTRHLAVPRFVTAGGRRKRRPTGDDEG